MKEQFCGLVLRMAWFRSYMFLFLLLVSEHSNSIVTFLVFIYYIFKSILLKLPVTVAERSKACNVFARSEAAIVGSNRTQGMDV
jgi:hypothetical protein